MHDVVRNVFTAIVRDMGFHVLQKQTHVLSPLTLQSSCCRIDVVLLIDGVCTSINVVIVNPI
jgi:hypothetical protein